MKKQLPLFIPAIILLFSFSLAHQALADACTDAPPDGYGGSCFNITCIKTAESTPLDSLFSTKIPNCISEFETNHVPKLTCSTTQMAVCGTNWYSRCCRAATTATSTVPTEPTTSTVPTDSTECAEPYSCQTSCVGTDIIQNKNCPENSNQTCCKKVCPQCKPTGQCTDSLKKDTSGTYQSCGTGNDCCVYAAQAKPTENTGGGGEQVKLSPNDLSPVGDIDVPTLIGVIVKGALGIVGSITLLMFVYGGFIMLISQGDSGKIDKGKKILVWSAIGVLIIFGSYIFVSYIISGIIQQGS